MEGSVRRVGDRLRVTAQLIDVATDRHLWSQTFDRDATDIFVIQADIARSIAEALKVRLGKAGAGNPGTENVVAYELYLLGLYHWNQRDGGRLAQGARNFPSKRPSAIPPSPGHSPG